MSGNNDDGLDELIALAAAAAVEIPTAEEVKARAERAARLARTAGSVRPVDSGRSQHPRLRVLDKPKR